MLQSFSLRVITIRSDETGADTYEELSSIFNSLQSDYMFALITQDIKTAKTIYEDLFRHGGNFNKIS